jgi:predicted enzyme related to lactoylglutathione lyase
MPESLFVHAGGGTLIMLYQRERTKADNTALTFEVDDLGATVADLRSHGVSFEEYDFPEMKTVGGIATRGADRAAWFKDSEGNTLCVHETLAA